ncbi:MAG TPA: RNase adapter RapZ [Thermodesulfobacteriaceae bacterium]|nr:RNase adapter RapZ [Thermodesulfobacteriaceae bacterium]
MSHSRSGGNVKLLIITGMAGSGKSTVLKALEDIGYYCIDNLPIALLPDLIALAENSTSMPGRIVLGMDMREENFLKNFSQYFRRIRKDGINPEILFLDAGDQVLLRRFNQTRRHHPLDPKNVLEGIRLEREQTRELRGIADRLMDTSDLNVHQLRQYVQKFYAPGARSRSLAIQLISFGFKYGIPPEANLVLDVRFLPNPYFEPELRPRSGCDREVRDYVLDKEETVHFLEKLEALLAYLIPRFREEGKSYLVIAVGCTGGRHRSVAIVEHLHQLFTKAEEDIIVIHRDLAMEE